MAVQTQIFALAVFFTAAFLKGITGLGFATVCLPMLASFMEPTASIPLVILPSLISNMLIMLQSGKFREALQRFWPIYLAAMPGLILGVYLLRTLDSSISRAVLGSILILYSLWAMRKADVALSPNLERWLLAPVGLMTGVVNGITGSQVMPILPFLLTLKIDKNLLLQTINLSFTLSSLMMIGLLSRFGLFEQEIFWTSLLGTIPVAAGITLGSKLRQRLPDQWFKRLVLGFLLALGISLVLRLAIAS